jgi:small-conductance mechanosensitive channel
MRSWLLRGLIFAFLMVVLRVVQGVMINTWETRAQMISIVLVAAYTILVLIWGFIDGRRDATSQPDPDRRADLAITWLLAGLVAGLLSGLVCWVISLFYKTIYVASLMNELTTFAAFTALLVFLIGMLGVAVGRFLVDRRYNKKGAPPRRREGQDEDNTDTDVFAAVGGGQQRAEEQPVEQAPTQQAPLHEGRTQEAPRPEHGQSS